MVIGTGITIGITLVSLIASILFFPKWKLGKISLDVFPLLSMAGAIILLCIGALPFGDFWASLTSDSAMNPLKILALFFSMSLLSIALDEAGFFAYVAAKASAKLKKSQWRLFLGLYALISLLTMLTSNDIIVLSFTPFLCALCKRSKVNPLPYLFMEFVAANTWSAFLLIGNPTNIYLSSAFSISFFGYIRVMALPTFVSGLLSLAILCLLFRKTLRAPFSPSEEELPALRFVPTFCYGLLLASATVLLALSNLIGLPMWIIASSFAGAALLCSCFFSFREKKPYVGRILLRVPWSLLPFVLSMFVLVEAAMKVGLLNGFSSWLASLDPVFAYGVSGAVAANLVNNIPMAMLYAELLQGGSLYGVFASILSSNIAAFMTPIGALAGIMWMGLLKKENVSFSFKDFYRYGLLIAVPTLFAGLGMLRLECFWGFC